MIKAQDKLFRIPGEVQNPELVIKNPGPWPKFRISYLEFRAMDKIPELVI
jgi:hypothetical protein